MKESELIQELQKAFDAAEDPDGYMTKWELSKALDRSTKWVGDRLRDLAHEGRLLSTRQRRPTIVAGQTCSVPVYKIKPESDAA